MLSTCPALQSTFIFEHTFEDGTPLHLWMGDRWNSKGPGGVGNASYVSQGAVLWPAALLLR